MSNRLQKAFRRAWREDARKVQNGRCAYCRDKIRAGTTTADHVIPLKAYGRDERGNIVAACLPCNRLKGHQTKNEFTAKMKHPQPGMPVAYWLAWSRRRINLALERLEKRLTRGG